MPTTRKALCYLEARANLLDKVSQRSAYKILLILVPRIRFLRAVSGITPMSLQLADILADGVKVSLYLSAPWPRCSAGSDSCSPRCSNVFEMQILEQFRLYASSLGDAVMSIVTAFGPVSLM